MSSPQLCKILTNSICGQRLGTTAATWNKLKQTTSDHKHFNGDLQSDGASGEVNPVPLVESGPSGEIAIWYEAQSTLEIWGWSSTSEYWSCHEPTEPKFQFIASDRKVECCYDGDTLVLQSKIEVPGRSIVAMTFMQTSACTLFIYLYFENQTCYMEIRDGSKAVTRVMNQFISGGIISLKASQTYLIVSNSRGYLYLMKYDPSFECFLKHTNCDGSLQSIYNHSTRLILDKEGVRDWPGNQILIKTAVHEECPIFDIMGSWLVYCPTKVEMDYYKNLQNSNDNASLHSRGKNDKRHLYTSVKLPPKGPLLLRVASSLANNAFDKIFQLSQMGTKTVKNYWNPGTNFVEKDISLQSISHSIGKAIYSTAHKIKKQADMLGEYEVIKIIDLANGKVMSTFKPPGGVSHLSLSEYDLQLAQATYRGDNLYLWDLYRLPKEVSLVGKFTRGKTSAVVKDLIWFVNKKLMDGLEVTNSGFGCITKKTGSVHWYNINYLFCANENDNFPNTAESSSQLKFRSGQFMDSWILPSMNAIKLVKLPQKANFSKESYEKFQDDENLEDRLSRLNEVAFIDSELNLRIFSPLNGKHTFRYSLRHDTTSIAQVKERSADAYWDPLVKRDSAKLKSHEIETPLSQTEIEACGPFSSIIKNKNVQIASYDIERMTQSNQGFWDLFATFGNDIPMVTHDFSIAPSEDSPETSSDDLLNQLNKGLVICAGEPAS